MAKIYMMEKVTMVSVSIDDSTDPPSMEFYDQRLNPMPDYEQPFGEEWEPWKRIDEATWKSIPSMYHDLAENCAKDPRDVFDGLTQDQIDGRAPID